MNKSLAIILFLLLGLLNSSCTVVRTVETLSPVQILSPSETNTLVAVTNTPFVGKENSPTNIPTFINTLSITPTSSKTPTPSPAILPTETPFPTTEAQATIAAYGPLCDRPYGSEISPNGQWIAVACIGTLDNPDTHLRVVSTDYTKDWKIYFGDYANGSLYDHKDGVLPYRWSKDGRFLYAAASSKASGCCWLGNYVLVVRLNLETGDQVDILNVLGREIWGISFTISTDDRYLIDLLQK